MLFFYDSINVFLLRESDRSCGFTAPGPLYFLRGILIRRTPHFKDGDLFLIGYNKSLCNLLYKLR